MKRSHSFVFLSGSSAFKTENPTSCDNDSISLRSYSPLGSEMSEANEPKTINNQPSEQLTISQKCINQMPTYHEARTFSATQLVNCALPLLPPFDDANLRNEFYTAFLNCIRSCHYPRFLSSLNDCLKRFYEEKLPLQEAFDYILQPRQLGSPGTPTESENGPVAQAPTNTAPVANCPISVATLMQPVNTNTSNIPSNITPIPNVSTFMFQSRSLPAPFPQYSMPPNIGPSTSCRMIPPPPPHPLMTMLYENVNTVLQNQQEILHQLSLILAHIKQDE